MGGFCITRSEICFLFRCKKVCGIIMVFLFGSQLKIVKDSGSVRYLCGDQIPR